VTCGTARNGGGCSQRTQDLQTSLAKQRCIKWRSVGASGIFPLSHCCSCFCQLLCFPLGFLRYVLLTRMCPHSNAEGCKLLIEVGGALPDVEDRFQRSTPLHLAAMRVGRSAARLCCVPLQCPMLSPTFGWLVRAWPGTRAPLLVSPCL